MNFQDGTTAMAITTIAFAKPVYTRVAHAYKSWTCIVERALMQETKNSSEWSITPLGRKFTFVATLFFNWVVATTVHNKQVETHIRAHKGKVQAQYSCDCSWGMRTLQCVTKHAKDCARRW